MKLKLKNKCTTPGCKKKCVGKHCSTCRSKATRAKDPVRYVFYNLRNRANQRPKEFTITLPEFRKWCADNNFPEEGYSVDREKNEHGYHIWNIQKLKLIDNINKYHHYDKYQHRNSGIEVIHDTKCHGTKVYTNVIDIGLFNCRIPAWAVEGSDDWQKIAPPIGDNEPLFSINDIRKAMMLLTKHPENLIGRKTDLLIHLQQIKHDGI